MYKLISFALSILLMSAACAAGSGECLAPKSLESEIQSHPSAALYGELGNWFVIHNQSLCAVETFRAGLRLVPDSADLWYLLGLTLNANGDVKDAIAPLQQAIRIEPKNIEFHLLLGAAFNELQQREQAIRAFEHVLAIDRHSIPALDALSKSLIGLGRYRRTIQLLRSAPRDESLTLDLAQAYHKAHLLPQSVQVLLPAVRKNPLSASLSLELVAVYLDQKRYPDALQLAEKTLRLHPDLPETQELYLHTLVLNHNLDKARTFAQTLLLRRPHDFRIVYWKGVLEREMGQYEIARRYLEEAVALNPADSNARYNLGIVLSELGDYAEAENELQKSLTLCAGVNEPQVRYHLASVLHSMGEIEQAKKQFKLTEKELQVNASKKSAYPMQGC
jgi:tetratricopeptide (TPR) repeat protein